MDDINRFEKQNSITISERSQYSDVLDNYDQVVKETNRNNSYNQETNDNFLMKSNENLDKNLNNNILSKESFPIPEDSKEIKKENKFYLYSKPSTRTINEEEEEEKDNNDNNINNKDSFDIIEEIINRNKINNNNINNNKINLNDSDSINLNNIVNNNINDSYSNSFNLNNINNNNISKTTKSKKSKKIEEEDIYSYKGNNSINNLESENCLNINKNDSYNEINTTINCKEIAEKNLEPLDSTTVNAKSSNNDNLNLNSVLSAQEKNKQEEQSKDILNKKFRSQVNINLKSTIFSGLDKRTNTVVSENNKRRKKRANFDLKNILKKAVILNAKKGRVTRLSNNNDNDSFLSNKFNSSFDNETLPINNIRFNDIKTDELNTNYLKKYLRRINVESKNHYQKNNFFKTLIELQNFYIDDSSVWVIKLSSDGRFLAAGCKSGKIKIYEIMGYNYSGYKRNYDKNDIKEYLNFINETPYKTLEKHKSDIIDLSWSHFYPNLLISASFDHYVYMWDISQEGNNCLIEQFPHEDIVTSVHFNPQIRNTFISGCLDTFVRIWKFNYFDNISNNFDDLNKLDNNIKNSGSNNNILSSKNIFDKSIKNKNKRNKKDNILENNKTNISFNDMNKTNTYLEQTNKNPDDNYFNIEHKITALSYFPDGSKIGIGTEKGRIYVYNTFPTINYNNNFFVSNKKFGIFHGGKKVTSIQFIDKIHAIVTTSDSLIRLVDMSAGRILYQYKGYANKNSMTRGYMDVNDDVIIVGGEDGYCYLWSLFDKENNKEKNINYECFKPFAKELIECSIIAHENCYVNYMQKILKLTNKILILSIIINGTSKGRLEILLNIDEQL